MRSLKETNEPTGHQDHHITGTPSLVTWLDMAAPSEIHHHADVHPDYDVSSLEQNRLYRGIPGKAMADLHLHRPVAL